MQPLKHSDSNGGKVQVVTFSENTVLCAASNLCNGDTLSTAAMVTGSPASAKQTSLSTPEPP